MKTSTTPRMGTAEDVLEAYTKRRASLPAVGLPDNVTANAAIVHGVSEECIEMGFRPSLERIAQASKMSPGAAARAYQALLNDGRLEQNSRVEAVAPREKPAEVVRVKEGHNPQVPDPKPKEILREVLQRSTRDKAPLNLSDLSERTGLFEHRLKEILARLVERTEVADINGKYWWLG